MFRRNDVRPIPGGGDRIPTKSLIHQSAFSGEWVVIGHAMFGSFSDRYCVCNLKCHYEIAFARLLLALDGLFGFETTDLTNGMSVEIDCE